MKTWIALARSILGMAIAAGPVAAQTTTAVDGFTPPMVAAGRAVGSYALTGIETVNLFSGGLTLRIPLVTLAGRGESGLAVSLKLQRRWLMEHTIQGTSPSASAIDADAFEPLNDYGPGRMTMREIGDSVFTCPGGAMYRNTLTRLVFRGEDGAEREFVDVVTGGAWKSQAPAEDTSGDSGVRYNCAVAGQSRGKIWVARDGSAATFVSDVDIQDGTSYNNGPPVPTSSAGAAPQGYLYERNGTVLRIDSGLVKAVRDRNGNLTHYNYGTNPADMASMNHVVNIVDSLNRNVDISYWNDNSTSTTFDRFDWISFPGTQSTQTIEVHYCFLAPNRQTYSAGCPHYDDGVAQSIATLFGYNSSPTIYNPYVVSYVKLPDGRRYQFSYNSYGEVTRVKLPTGGSLEYTYGAGLVGGEASGVIGPVSNKMQVYRRVLERRTYVGFGTLEGKTVFSATAGASCPAGVTYCTIVGTVHKDSADKVLSAERHYFGGGIADPASYFEDGTHYFSKFWEGREYKTEYLAIPESSFDVFSAGTLRSTTDTWVQRACEANELCLSPSGTGVYTSIDPRLLQRVTVDGTQSASQVFGYDRFNNVTSQEEYGFDGSLLRKTKTDFVTTNTVGTQSLDYVNLGTTQQNPTIHIRNLPSKISVFSAGGVTEFARTTFTYDRYDQDGNCTAQMSPLGWSNPVLWDSSVPAGRGNVTTKSRWLNDGPAFTSSLDTCYQYDLAGGVVKVLDPMNRSTGIVRGPSYFGAWPTQITNALQQSSTIAYYVGTGAVSSYSDVAGATTSYLYNDPLGRLTEVDSPDGGVTTFGYCDTEGSALCPSNAPQNSVTKTVRQNSCGATSSIRSDSVYDGLGRTYLMHQTDGSSLGPITVRTKFDGLGRPSAVSNPGRTDSPPDLMFTQYTYDALGRPWTTTSPGQNPLVSTTAWAGPEVTVSDTSGRRAVRTNDALGRLVQVVEGTSNGVKTTYTYNALDNLTTVCQGGDGADCTGGQARSFVYDSLGRLTSATNPESETTGYTYDSNGNMRTKTDARGWMLTYEYDPINRPKTKWASHSGPINEGVAAPTVDWKWDLTRAGSLSSVSASDENGVLSTTSFLSYDAMGRVTGSQQVTAGKTGTFSYVYNKAGDLEQITYPSAAIVKTCYDVAGRPTAASKVDSNGTEQRRYVSQAQWADHGALSTAWMSNERIYESRSYNQYRLQPTALQLGTSASSPRSVLGLDLYHCPSKLSSDTCATNNGNLVTATLSWLSVDQNYGYDNSTGFDRLTSATETAAPGQSGWSENFGYDQHANMWVSASSGLTLSAWTPISAGNFDGNRNRLNINGSHYERAGTLNTIGGYTFTVDAEGRMASSTLNGVTTTYTYDGEGRRVKKQKGASAATVYVYTAGGELAAEYGPGTVSPCSTCYLAVDHLGTTRAVVDEVGAVKERHDYLPFGDELTGNGRTVGLGYVAASLREMGFTGKERDSAAENGGLDYFGARYFSGAQGRFTSPDVPFADQNTLDPQSWNLYGFVRNNPLRYLDPDGRACVVGSDGKEYDDNSGGQSCADAHSKDQNNKVSATVYGGPNAAAQEVKDAVGAFVGNGPKEIEYGPDDPFTQEFQKSAGMDAIRSGIQSNCSVTTGAVPVGTAEAFVNTLIDGIPGNKGFLTPEAQLGAFNSTYIRDGGRAEVTVTNPISLNSLLLHIPAKLGIKNPTAGRFGTVNQTLHIVIADPCAKR